MPMKATLKPKEVLKATKLKRKSPLARHAVPSQRRKSGSNQDKSHPVVDEAHVNDYVSDSAEVIENSRLENDQEKSAKSRDFATQTDVSKHELSYKLEAMMMMKNTAKSRKSTNIVSNIAFSILLGFQPFSTINSRIEEMVISAGDTVLDTSDQLLTFATLF